MCCKIHAFLLDLYQKIDKCLNALRIDFEFIRFDQRKRLIKWLFSLFLQLCFYQYYRKFKNSKRKRISYLRILVMVVDNCGIQTSVAM